MSFLCDLAQPGIELKEGLRFKVLFDQNMNLYINEQNEDSQKTNCSMEDEKDNFMDNQEFDNLLFSYFVFL